MTGKDKFGIRGVNTSRVAKLLRKARSDPRAFARLLIVGEVVAERVSRRPPSKPPLVPTAEPEEGQD